jgi:tetratricopeptide (TPR) repeat protein
MLLAEKPAEALEFYRKAFAISSELSSADTLNIHHRSSLADALLGIGQALNRLGNKEEAIQNLTRALDLEKSIQAVAPERIFLLRTLSRTYMELGSVLLEKGEAQEALKNYREGLASAEKSLERAPTSLSHALDRADLLEASGKYYLTLARKPNTSPARRSELKAEAQSSLENELAIWQAWARRRVATRYAARRETRVLAYLADCHQP